MEDNRLFWPSIFNLCLCGIILTGVILLWLLYTVYDILFCIRIQQIRAFNKIVKLQQEVADLHSLVTFHIIQKHQAYVDLHLEALKDSTTSLQILTTSIVPILQNIRTLLLAPIGLVLANAVAPEPPRALRSTLATSLDLDVHAPEYDADIDEVSNADEQSPSLEEQVIPESQNAELSEEITRLIAGIKVPLQNTKDISQDIEDKETSVFPTPYDGKIAVVRPEQRYWTPPLPRLSDNERFHTEWSSHSDNETSNIRNRFRHLTLSSGRPSLEDRNASPDRWSDTANSVPSRISGSYSTLLAQTNRRAAFRGRGRPWDRLPRGRNTRSFQARQRRFVRAQQRLQDKWDRRNRGTDQ